MELFIQIRDGQPFEHPIFGDNFREAFPSVDVDNLPPEFARFERVECPHLATTFQVDEVSYQWVNGMVKDVWSVREMTAEERTQKIQHLTDKANIAVQQLKGFAEQHFDAAPDAVAKQTWSDYLVQLNAWILVDPTNPQIPMPPRFNSDGALMATTDAGSQPNVIG
jgi:hypothetical protein